MTRSIGEIAEAFSRHRFTETYPHLAPDVQWVAVGRGTVEGRDAVIGACDAAAAEMSRSTTEFTRFVSVVGAEGAAVDVVARYTGTDGGVSVVSSCDLYEFAGGALARITSYAVELPTG